MRRHLPSPIGTALFATLGLAACGAPTAPSSRAALAPSAPRASGGTSSGGVNSGGVTGGGGGGGGGGGTEPCATISALAVSTGFAPGSFSTGAVWVNFTVQSCAGEPMTVSPVLSETVVGDTTPVYFAGYPGSIPQGKSLSEGTFDNETAPLSTTYDVTLKVTDQASGAVLATRTARVSTPAPKAGA